MAEKTPEEKALGRIEKAIKNGSTRLDLTNLGLSKLPPEIGSAVNLLELNVSYNEKITFPPEFSKLQNLTTIDASNNFFDVFPSEICEIKKIKSINLSNKLEPRYSEEYAYHHIKLFIDSIPKEFFLLTDLQIFSIKNNLIAELPSEIGKLINLWKLDISNNELETLPEEIGNLLNLRELDLGGNLFNSLPTSIIKLKKLTWLNIGGNQFETIPQSIYKFQNMETLMLGGNRIKTIHRKISKLKKIKHLDVKKNLLKTLPSEIGMLEDLTLLDVRRNLISKLPIELGLLKNLQKFYAGGNQITSLPKEFRNLKHLETLDLQRNNLSIPVEIISNIADPESILSAFWGKRRPLNETKLIIIGQGSVGKTSLVRRITANEFDVQEEKTQGILITKWKPDESIGINSYHFKEKQTDGVSLDELFVMKPEIFQPSTPESASYYTKKAKKKSVVLEFDENIGEVVARKKDVNNKIDNREVPIIPNEKHFIDTSYISSVLSNVERSTRQRTTHSRLNIWDFGGQEIMHATHQFFLTKRSLYLLVLDSRLTQEENRVEYWLKIIQSFGGESPVLIVGNKIDQHPLDIDRTGLQKKYPNIVGILETSAATSAGIEELKAAIAEQVNNLPHVRDLLPEAWFTVKTKLEELGKQSNFITHDKYLDLCAENEVSDETSQRTLIGFLHDLGVVLHFQDDPRLEALGILNPQWVTNGVYKILNSHTLFQNKGVLTTSMLDEILNLPEYPRGKRLFIVDMMKKFELCYDIEPDKSFLVPDLLPKDQPAELKFNGVPAFEYAYPVLPSSVITRFIVRMNQKIDDGFVWRTGVVLKIGDEAPGRGNKALVKADIEDRKITIAIDGVEHTRRDALSAIRFQLDEIHGSIKGLDAQKRVPIPEAPNAEPLEYDYLLMLEREGQEIYLAKDKSRLVKVNIRQLLSGIESEAHRRENAPGSVTTNYYIQGDVNASGDFIGRDKNTSPRDQRDE